MLSEQAKQDVISKINTRLGYDLSEAALSPSMLRAITSLAIVQKHLYVVKMILGAELSRVERHALLRLANKVRPNLEMTVQGDEISRLQTDIDSKANDLADRILNDHKAQMSGEALASTQTDKPIVTELKCVSCGAQLPIPTARFVKCRYCGTTFSITELAPQLKSMIQSI